MTPADIEYAKLPMLYTEDLRRRAGANTIDVSAVPNTNCWLVTYRYKGGRSRSEFTAQCRMHTGHHP